ncbi:heavy metal translocating P-type ATPase [Agrococcus sp. Marseille-Q4369]|uniref:heavy metal translocating P-type ATPase n=1 Tax=Agrococcus sp. Marseille-Q4369 TaxID=2810513 RepID=UPI001B8D501C|nr:heavy metal translocating P-type ATPase [Agrococcus sp. Marseille-Q4369]QUW19672.1 copper-translocating P-type ATPase [Agrococcus sp. Marseille-Q4369]
MAEAQIVELEIGGMTCASCAGRIERKLGKLPGVEASVNYATEVARVTLPSGMTVDDAIRTVEQTGYTAALPAPETERDEHGTRLATRLIASAALAVPVGVLSMIPALQFPGWQWVALVLTLPVAVWGAWPFHRAAAINLRHGAATMDTLISLGVTAALGWSLWALVLGDAGHIGMRMEMSWFGGHGDELYLEVAALVTVFLLAGRVIESRAKRSNQQAMRALARLGAKEVTRVGAAGDERIPVGQLAVGDRFRVVPGEKIATDGVVVEGASAIDASLLTGESLPVEVTAGSEVVGATINGHGMLVVRARRVGADTELERIASLLRRAQDGKADVQRLADRVSQWFVPAVLVLALGALIGWIVLTGDVAAAFTAAVATLIIACPCALGLATPTALLVGTTRGAELGVLIRDARVLESSRGISAMLVDKTGTVTEGRMRVEGVVAAAGEDADEALRIAAAVERASEHPIARAIAAAAPDAPVASDVRAAQGAGVVGVAEGRAVQVGKPAWLADDWGVSMPSELADAFERFERKGATALAVAWDGRMRAVIGVRDTVKATSRAAVERLARLGVEVVMLTGDHERAARAVADEVGIERVIAGVSPAEKVDAVRAEQARGAKVAMAGDGVNDAAALAAADLGLAMGTGTDAAQQAADITLVHGDLAGAADAIALSRRTLRTIRGNLFWAFAYNVLAIPLAMAGMLSPLIAGAAMAFSSVFVVLHSLTLRWFRPIA